MAKKDTAENPTAKPRKPRGPKMVEHLKLAVPLPLFKRICERLGEKPKEAKSTLQRHVNALMDGFEVIAEHGWQGYVKVRVDPKANDYADVPGLVTYLEEQADTYLADARESHERAQAEAALASLSPEMRTRFLAERYKQEVVEGGAPVAMENNSADEVAG